MGRKSTAEVAIRRSDVYDMMMQGKSTLHIIAFINQHYGTARSTTERDITEVLKGIREYFAKDKDTIISEHVARYEHIYEQCLSVGDTKGAMQAMKQKEQLMRLLEDTPVVAIQNNTLNIDWSGKTLEELKQLLNK